MNLIERFDQFILKERLFSASDHLLLTISGGVDSVVLCDLCHLSGYSFRIAHCNFGLRGAESERDEDFVKTLAKKYQVELLVKRFDTANYAKENGLSIQVAARQLRYDWFYQVADVQYILTAHHADDNMETVLMNFFKGTGIAGLHGILPKQDRLVRPLLFASKENILAYAKANGLNYVEDSSNQSDKYTRNYFRNQLIPALEKVYPEVKENLHNNIARFRDTEVLYRQSVDQHKKKLMEYKGSDIHIPILKLLKSHPVETILYEIIKDFHFTPHQVKDILQIAGGQSGKYIASSTHRVISNRNWLIITPLKSEESALIVIEEKDGLVTYPGGQVKIKTIQVTGLPSLDTDASVGMMDAA
ncbi:MAG: tRNA lysidine(34) synthetase TilS, partial [Chitinophagaceae bacterium]|nr:tRNA lysidine(34) synthetase TilS [Chitinophagaceae bacterium]